MTELGGIDLYSCSLRAVTGEREEFGDRLVGQGHIRRIELSATAFLVPLFSLRPSLRYGCEILWWVLFISVC